MSKMKICKECGHRESYHTFAGCNVSIKKTNAKTKIKAIYECICGENY